MSKKTSASIDEIVANKWVVEFNRKPLDRHPLYGFIVDFNSEFTLIHIFDKDLFILDGYCVFPNIDVKKYAAYDNQDYFLSEAIRAKKIVPIGLKLPFRERKFLAEIARSREKSMSQS